MTEEPGPIEVERTLTQEDFDRFARLSGDDNPIHVDPAFAARTRFGGTVAHGVLLLSILRGLAERLVPGGRQRSQQLMFPAATFAGEPIRFRAERLSEEAGEVKVAIRSTRVRDGATTCEGMLVLLRVGTSR